jgi:hypothetical protein
MYAPRPDLSTARWRKSSYSNGGANNCVEVADSLPWRKSSYSNGGDNNCVEVADCRCAHVVPVRDSKAPNGPVLLVPALAWRTFLTTVKA